MDSVLYSLWSGIKVLLMLIAFLILLYIIFVNVMAVINAFKKTRQKTVGTFYIKTKGDLNEEVFSINFEENPKDFINEDYIVFKVESDL